MSPEYVGDMTPEEEAEWKVLDMQNVGRNSPTHHPAPLPDEAMAGEQEID